MNCPGYYPVTKYYRSDPANFDDVLGPTLILHLKAEKDCILSVYNSFLICAPHQYLAAFFWIRQGSEKQGPCLKIPAIVFQLCQNRTECFKKTSYFPYLYVWKCNIDTNNDLIKGLLEAASLSLLRHFLAYLKFSSFTSSIHNIFLCYIFRGRRAWIILYKEGTKRVRLLRARAM